MTWHNTVFAVINSILTANLLIIAILIVSYIIEKITALKLFIGQFKWQKSKKNAKINVDGASVSYFLFVMGVFIYDIYKSTIDFNFSSISFFLITMIPLVVLFRKYYNKYQGVDPEKADDDFS